MKMTMMINNKTVWRVQKNSINIEAMKKQNKIDPGTVLNTKPKVSLNTSKFSFYRYSTTLIKKVIQIKQKLKMSKIKMKTVKLNFYLIPTF